MGTGRIQNGWRISFHCETYFAIMGRRTRATGVELCAFDYMPKLTEHMHAAATTAAVAFAAALTTNETHEDNAVPIYKRACAQGQSF